VLVLVVVLHILLHRVHYVYYVAWRYQVRLLVLIFKARLGVHVLFKVRF
jgi:hypothetical protein